MSIYKQIHNIGLSLLIIGLINIYNIVKEGIIINTPTNIEKESIYNSILNINNNNIKIVLFITIVLSIIINLHPKSSTPQWGSISDKIISTNSLENTIISSDPLKREMKIEKREKIEYELLLGFGLLGLIIMSFSNEIILLYLGLELYSYTTYVLILVKETLLIRRISIIYLIISSLMSALILFSFSMLYKSTGSLNLEVIYNIVYGTTNSIKLVSFTNSLNSLVKPVGLPTALNACVNLNLEDINKYVYFIILAFLFKLGTGPFIYWVIRVYNELDKRIFWYQITIPKFIFFILLLKFLSLDSNINSNYLSYSIFIVAILSIIIGTIGGLFQNKDNMLLSYSSILNIGYVLLSLFFIYIIRQNISNNNILEHSQLWILIQYFIVYIINLLGLFSVLYLFKRSSMVLNFRSFFLYPSYFFCFIILILSFIGVPPLSGFFSKFYLFYTFLLFPNLSTISLTIFILSTLISSFFYLKFLFSSSSDSSLSKLNLVDNYSTTILAFSTLFSIFYSFYFSSLLPFYIF